MPVWTKSVDRVSDPSSSGSNKADDEETEENIESAYEPPAPFSIRLSSKKNTAQMDKIMEIFKQVKVNVPLMDDIAQFPSYTKFLKDLCTKKRAYQAPKKVFLATNIREIIKSMKPMKYKDPGLSRYYLHHQNHCD